MKINEWIKILAPDMESFKSGVSILVWVAIAALGVWFIITFGAYIMMALMVTVLVCLCGKGNQHSKDISAWFKSRLSEMADIPNKHNVGNSGDDSEEHD